MGFLSWLSELSSIDDCDAVSNPCMTSSYDEFFDDNIADSAVGGSTHCGSTGNFGSLFEDGAVNPANGLPMIGSIDIIGNVFGTGSSHDNMHSGIDNFSSSTIDDSLDICGFDDSFCGLGDDDFGCSGSFDDDSFGMSISDDW